MHAELAAPVLADVGVSCVCSASAASAVPCPLSAHALALSLFCLPRSLPPPTSSPNLVRCGGAGFFKRVGRAQYNPGETMIQQGKFSDSDFIRKGTVNIIKDTKQVAQRGKGV